MTETLCPRGARGEGNAPGKSMPDGCQGGSKGRQNAEKRRGLVGGER